MGPMGGSARAVRRDDLGPEESSSMADAALRTILDQQQSWASGARIELDEASHASHWPDNLFAPLDDRSLAELEASARHPFGEGDKPGPLHALHSTLALVVNSFAYWRVRDSAPLATALGLDRAPTELRFAPAYPCGVDDRTIELDVEIDVGSAPRTLVWAAHCEPYAQVDTRLPAHLEATADCFDGLHGCRLLAEDVRANAGRYRRVPVGRLLERIRALSQAFGTRGFRLLLLWHELPCLEARELRTELARLRARIGGEVDLRALTWRSLVDGVARNHPEHVAYTRYLRARYLGS